MFPVKVGVRRYHLRLKPDTKLHAKLVHLVDEVFQAAFYLFLIYLPVTKRTVVGISPAKPAIVHDKHFNAKLRRLPRDGQELLRVKVEVGRLPVID